LWLVDWLDQEDDDFRWASRRAGVEMDVVRAPPLGPTVGTRRHRLRSYPAYASLAAKGMARGKDRPVVSWQPLAAALLGLARRRRRPGRLVALNPILVPERSRRQSLVLAGLRRADRVLFPTRRSLEIAVAVGLDRARTRFVPLGVRARPELAARPRDGYLLAVGRDSRDWETLAGAVEGLERDVLVRGPATAPAGLKLAPAETEFFSLLAGASAVVVPLARVDRPLGILSCLAAMSVGRAVVATRTEGDEDYLSDEYSIRVPPRDSGALRAALERVGGEGVAERLGGAALAAAESSFPLEGFVRAVNDEAHG
jgi:hypothetical protein